MIYQRPTRLGPVSRPLVERIAEKIEIADSGCWLWTGTIGDDGYGKIMLGSRADGTRSQRQAHRVVWELLADAPPPTIDLDHQCHNDDASCPGGRSCIHRRCVRPTHIVVASRGDNLRRGRGPTGMKARQTHCIRGHVFDVANTFIAPNGTRKCRACRRDQARERRRLVAQV